MGIVLCQTNPAFAANNLVLRDDARCARCHDAEDSPQVVAIGRTRHGVNADGRTPSSCTTCHGESDAHVNYKGGGEPPEPDRTFDKDSVTPVAQRNEVCLSCHEGNARTHWTGSQHEARGLACTSCHNLHGSKDRVYDKNTQPEVCYKCHKTQRAETHRISTHPIAAGKVVCSECHNPHGSIGPKLVAKNSINETCFNCHAEKRGPFLWEHPVAIDNCMNCHSPHGSTNQALLRMRPPWLCQRCHGDGAPHPGAIYSGANLPGGTVTTMNQTAPTATNPINPLTGRTVAQTSPASQLALRGCANCHSQIHGSNHPAGKWFAR